MILHRKDIDKVKEILDKFPDVEVFEIEQDSSSGIGSIVSITFSQEVNGIRGSFEIEISGVENW
jgi:hypothetical protein